MSAKSQGMATTYFTETSNRALARRDIVDTGNGIATVPVLKALHDQVWTATYRMHPANEAPVEQDFYSPKIQPGSIRPGTAIYDINGHVGLVYEIAADGRVLYMDAYPDEHVSRSFYGLQFGQSPSALGGGFQEFSTFEAGRRDPDSGRLLHRRHDAARIKRGRFRIIRSSSIEAMCRTRMQTVRARSLSITVFLWDYSNMRAPRCPVADMRTTRFMS